MPVVEVIPERPCGAPRLRVGVGVPVGPFAQGGLDESLSPAVGLGPVGARELLADAQGVDSHPRECAHAGRTNEKPPAVCVRRGFDGVSLTMTYFHARMCTIIGAVSFHGPVRDGKVWFQDAMVVRL